MKVLTHRPRYIEPATVPEFVGEASSATEVKKPIPAQKAKELSAIPKAEKIEESKAKGTKISEILSPSAEIEVPQAQKGPAVTPKRKRMVNVLDVLETIKSSNSTPKKLPKLKKHKLKQQPLEAKLQSTRLKSKLDLQSLPKKNPWKPKEKVERKLQSKFCLKKLFLQLSKHPPNCLIILCDMLRAKYYLKKKNEKLIITLRN
jgi:hypothetical protein